jgi:hypothetical protein
MPQIDEEQKLNHFWQYSNSKIRENKVSPNFGFVFVLQLFKVFRQGKLAEYTHHAAREKAATVFLMPHNLDGL